MKSFPFRTISPVAAVALAFAAIGCSGDTSSSTSSSDKSSSSTTSSSTTSAKNRPASTGAGNKVTGDKIVIGLVASQGGNLRPWGVDSVAGAELAVDDFNKAGGVDGKKVQLLIEDSNSKPEQGKSACDKLISEGAIAVLGEVASGITAQMIGPCFEKGVPIVAIGATRTDLTDQGDNVFRVCYTDKFQGPVMASFAYNVLGKRKAALMTDKTQPYSTGLSNSFRDYFTKLGGQVVDEEFYDGSQPSYTAQLTNLKDKQPDCLFMSGYFTETGPIAKQAREAGIDKSVPLLGGDGWDSKDILQSGGDAILGSFFCNHYNNEETGRPEVTDFLSKWKAAYSNSEHGSVPATTMGALAFDAAGVVCAALKSSKAMDSKTLRDAIDATDGYKGVSGTITLKGNHGDPPKDAIVVQLKNDPSSPNGQVFAKRYSVSDIPDDPSAKH